MNAFSRSVRTYLLAAMACLSIPGLVALAYMAQQSFSDVQRNMRLAGLVDADRALLLAGNTIRTNRGQAQTSIQAENDATPLIKKVEEANRAELAAAIARVRATDLPDRNALAEAIAQREQQTNARLGDIYAEAAKPKAQRSLAPTMPWYNGVGEIEAAIVKASDATSNAVRLADPYLADLQSFKSAGWRVRSSYGMQCSVLRPMMGSGKALDAGQQRALGEIRGAAGVGVAQLRQLAARPGVGTDLAAKVGAMVAEVETANRRIDDLVGKLGAGTGAVIDAEEWTRLCNGPFGTIVAAVTQSLDDMASYTEGELNAAWIRLAAIGGLLGALSLLCFFSWRGIQRRVARPMISLKSALDAMQAGDFSRPIPPHPYPDEVGALSEALELYRGNALTLEANRRERETAMLTEAEQAASVQSLVRDVAVIVAAARAGDFSGHADAGRVDGPLREMVEGVNEINRLVDGATNEFVAVLEALAQGDLTHQIRTPYQGRFGALRDALNETIERLSETVSTIQRTALDTGNAAREINAGADDLSRRTEEQASSLEETAATTEELAASVKASAQASRNAVGLAEDAKLVAQDGGAIVTQAIAAMSGIEQASRKISDINSVIDDIAFQTNLLALNAAVEAARAGESGKGFAVVASEVRTLAQRSAEAAKDITALINSSNDEVTRGVALVRSAGEALGKIVEASQRVAATVAQISAASAEQANGIDEMSQTVAHMDEMTQQNAALAEQSAASATALTGQIQRLNALVAAFQTREGQERPVASLRSAA